MSQSPVAGPCGIDTQTGNKPDLSYIEGRMAHPVIGPTVDY